MPKYNLVIAGGGPAGLTAALYAARAGLEVLLLEKTACGGQMLLTEAIENFPGFPAGIKGQEFTQRLQEQARQAGAKIIIEEVKEIAVAQGPEALPQYRLKTENNDYLTASIILALGAFPKRLGLSGEEKLTGRGVSYCAICDGPLFRGKEVVVIGGGNAACEEALYLSKFASAVTLIHRRDKLRADKVLADRLSTNAKIKIIYNSVVEEMLGEQRVDAVRVKELVTGKKRELYCGGVFIFAGLKPNTDFLGGLVKMDKDGFIVTAENLVSSRQGIFACGDCRARILRQIVTAAGEGASAAQACRNYIEG